MLNIQKYMWERYNIYLNITRDLSAGTGTPSYDVQDLNFHKNRW